MSIKLNIECYRALLIASSRTGLSFSDIGNKALRKFDRLETPALVAALDNFKTDYPLMQQPTNLRLKPSLAKGKSPAIIRHIITWYLAAAKVDPPRPPLQIDPADVELMYRAPQGEDLAQKYLEYNEV